MNESAYQIVVVSQDKNLIFTKARNKYLKKLRRANASMLRWIKAHNA